MNARQSSASQINKYTIADGLTECCWYRSGTFIGDGKVELDSEDDAATANWGSGWQIPSEAQVEVLVSGDYTYTEWVKTEWCKRQTDYEQGQWQQYLPTRCGHPLRDKDLL